MQKPCRHWWSAHGWVVGVCLGLLAGCGDTQPPPSPIAAETAPPVFPASLMEGMPPLSKELPPETAKEVAALLEKEEKWLVTPPKDKTSAQLDKDFADLRWEVARKFGTHDVEGAISYARSSLSLDEAHPKRWEILGDWCSLAGDPASQHAAANAYDNATFLNPSAPGPHRKLAAAYMILKRHREAAMQLEYCLALADEEEERELVPLYAAECAAAGEFKRGIAFCQKIAETSANPQFRLAWAILEKASGNHYAAIRLLMEVEQAESKVSPFAAYATTLRTRYEKEKGGAK